MSALDQVTLETAATRRQRLLASLTFGRLSDRRVAGDNRGRFIGSAVLAALVCAVCLGISFVTTTLNRQTIQKTEGDYIAALNGAAAVPADATKDSHGYPIDRSTGWAKGPLGRWYDPRTGWQVDTGDGRLVDAQTGWEVDPRTGHATGKAHLT